MMSGVCNLFKWRSVLEGDAHQTGNDVVIAAPPIIQMMYGWAGSLRWGNAWRKARRTNKEATMRSMSIRWTLHIVLGSVVLLVLPLFPLAVSNPLVV
jgi:hypothetical protein